MLIQNTITLMGNGLFSSQSLQADFIRNVPSYNPDVDPRLPKHDIITTVFTANSNVITVSNISKFPSPNVTLGESGTVRILQEVIRYSNVSLANSSVFGLTRTVGNTVSCTISGNVAANTVISSLGLSTLN
jgi:hypothetical protein